MALDPKDYRTRTERDPLEEQARELENELATAQTPEQASALLGKKLSVGAVDGLSSLQLRSMTRPELRSALADRVRQLTENVRRQHDAALSAACRKLVLSPHWDGGGDRVIVPCTKPGELARDILRTGETEIEVLTTYDAEAGVVRTSTSVRTGDKRKHLGDAAFRPVPNGGAPEGFMVFEVGGQAWLERAQGGPHLLCEIVDIGDETITLKPVRK